MERILTPERLGFFKRNGYLLVPGLYDAEEMNEIRAWTEEISHAPEIPGRFMMYFEESLLQPGRRILNRVENIEPFHSGFSSLFHSAKMQGCVDQLFAEPSILFKDKINFKLPGGGGFKAHQDVQAGWGRYASLHITALISVDAATPQNGCLELVPGYHDKGLLGEFWKPLPEEELRYIRCPTEPGDALFFDSFIPHRSGPNRTDSPRRMLYVTYNRLREGDHRRQYYADKRSSYPPDCERLPDRQYVFRV